VRVQQSRRSALQLQDRVGRVVKHHAVAEERQPERRRDAGGARADHRYVIGGLEFARTAQRMHQP